MKSELTDPEYWRWAVDNGYITPRKVKIEMSQAPSGIHVIEGWREPRKEPRQDELD